MPVELGGGRCVVGGGVGDGDASIVGKGADLPVGAGAGCECPWWAVISGPAG